MNKLKRCAFETFPIKLISINNFKKLLKIDQLLKYEQQLNKSELYTHTQIHTFPFTLI